MVTYLAAFVQILFTAMFFENIIFARALGTSTLFKLIRKGYKARLFGIIMLFFVIFASSASFLINKYVFMQWVDKYYYAPLTYILTIGIVYIFLLVILSRAFPRVFRLVKNLIHLAAFNCAILGGILLATTDSMLFLSYWKFIGFCIGTVIGFVLTAYLVEIAYPILYSEKIPAAFRGFPISLIYLGILSMAIYGLYAGHLPF